MDNRGGDYRGSKRIWQRFSAKRITFWSNQSKNPLDIRATTRANGFFNLINKFVGMTSLKHQIPTNLFQTDSFLTEPNKKGLKFCTRNSTRQTRLYCTSINPNCKAVLTDLAKLCDQNFWVNPQNRCTGYSYSISPLSAQMKIGRNSFHRLEATRKQI